MTSVKDIYWDFTLFWSVWKVGLHMWYYMFISENIQNFEWKYNYSEKGFTLHKVIQDISKERSWEDPK